MADKSRDPKPRQQRLPLFWDDADPEADDGMNADDARKRRGGATSAPVATPPPAGPPAHGAADRPEPVERKSKTPLKIVQPSTPPPITDEGPISTPPAGVILDDSEVREPARDDAPRTSAGSAGRSGLILKKPGDSGRIAVPDADTELGDDAPTELDTRPAVPRPRSPRARAVVETETSAASAAADDAFDTAHLAVTEVAELATTRVAASPPTMLDPSSLDDTPLADPEPQADDASPTALDGGMPAAAASAAPTAPDISVGDDAVDIGAPTIVAVSTKTQVAPREPEGPRRPAIKVNEMETKMDVPPAPEPAGRPKVAKPQVTKPITGSTPAPVKPTVARPPVAKAAAGKRGPDPDSVETAFALPEAAAGKAGDADADDADDSAVIDEDFRELGLKLQQAREARGLSIEQVAESTHIRANLIDLLERQAYDDMPVAAVYTRTYIKTLCKLYDLSPGPFLNDLERHLEARGDLSISTATHVSSTKVLANADAGDEKLSASTLSRAFMILGAVVLVLLILATLRAIFFGDPSVQGTASPIEDTAVEQVLEPEILPTRLLPIPSSGSQSGAN